MFGVLLAVVAATSMQRRVYLRWISGWVRRAPVERLLTEPLPGGVVGLAESDFSGDGYVALVESGVRLTERPRPDETTWGAFWHDVTGYVVLRESGAVRIDISGCGSVNVDTGSGAVQDHWESVLGMKGVPPSES